MFATPLAHQVNLWRCRHLRLPVQPLVHDAEKALETMVREPGVRLMPAQVGGGARGQSAGSTGTCSFPTCRPTSS